MVHKILHKVTRSERNMELDEEIQRCENSLLEAQETNMRCQEAHENVERALISQEVKCSDIPTNKRRRWSSAKLSNSMLSA
jgi:translation initiation factor 2B subunit (eIF-2B alpha/beta/delta family)